jgi:hypothetical protein
MLFEQKLLYLRPREWATKKLHIDSTYHERPFPNGASDSSRIGLMVFWINIALGDQRFFPPKIAIEVKALACELPSRYGIPFSRFSAHDIAALAEEKGIVASISDTTVWRWLTEDAIKPWQYCRWIFPRDSQFERKAARVLDLYHHFWKGKALTRRDYVVCTDEKTSIQARHRKHRTLPTLPGKSMLIEDEYERKGALAYLAVWDVHRAKLFGMCNDCTGIEPFDRLVAHVMSQYPYHGARRVFWIIDSASYHRGDSCVKRLTEKWPNIVPVHLPVHASWLNQIETFFSIVQRKVLTPNAFISTKTLEKKIMAFQHRYETLAKPFEWKFTKNDLHELMTKLDIQLKKV